VYTVRREVVNGSTPGERRGLPEARRHGYMPSMARLVLLALVAGACSSTPKGIAQVKITPPPAPATTADLAGPLCATGEGFCSCRDPRAGGDGGAGEPEAGRKRFEIRLGPSEHELWATLGDRVIYKSRARAEDCFYVDLGPGDVQMGLRASNSGGVQTRIDVREYSPATKSWYDTFTFECGSPGVCGHDELDEQKSQYATYTRGIHDPCGSVKIKQIGWDSGVAPDQLHPDDLQVAWVMLIYEFAPKKPHGDASCANRFE
jgi:hypothetical protein